MILRERRRKRRAWWRLSAPTTPTVRSLKAGEDGWHWPEAGEDA